MPGISGSSTETGTVASLFSGIGGFELGLREAGHRTDLMCEIDPAAQAVLRHSFPDTHLASDIVRLRNLPSVETVVAGFPCQNLSLAGDNTGIHGSESGLIKEVFRLIGRRARASSPRWLVLENVPFMLWHRKAEAIRMVTEELSRVGFMWAHRVVDARSFGLPQRRRRVLIVASRTEDPRDVLFSDDAGKRSFCDDGAYACGFYWTEGRGGLGWAVNGTPTLKGGSAVGIPSPPAIWMRSQRRIVTPELRDAERLQGFAPDWTAVAVSGKDLRQGARWKLVGNAISVPMAAWVGRQLASPSNFDMSRSKIWQRSVWPNAAWSDGKKIYEVDISEFPEHSPYQDLTEFLQFEPRDLSARAAAGFLKRARAGSLCFADNFLEAVESHQKRIEKIDRRKARTVAA